VIICTEHTLAIGEAVQGPVSDSNLIRHVVAFVVIREATEEEYRQRAAELSSVDNPPFDVPMRFYEVAMD